MESMISGLEKHEAGFFGGKRPAAGPVSAKSTISWPICPLLASFEDFRDRTGTLSCRAWRLNQEADRSVAGFMQGGERRVYDRFCETTGPNLLQRCQSLANGVLGKLGDVVDLQFFHDVLPVRINGRNAHMQFRCNFLR